MDYNYILQKKINIVDTCKYIFCKQSHCGSDFVALIHLENIKGMQFR